MSGDGYSRVRAQAYGEEVIDYEERVAFSPVYRTGLFHCADVYLQTPIREVCGLSAPACLCRNNRCVYFRA